MQFVSGTRPHECGTAYKPRSARVEASFLRGGTPNDEMRDTNFTNSHEFGYKFQRREQVGRGSLRARRHSIATESACRGLPALPQSRRLNAARFGVPPLGGFGLCVTSGRMNAEFRTMACTPFRVLSGQAVPRPNNGFFVASQVNSHQLIQTIPFKSVILVRIRVIRV